jgi:hypothetical protein
MLDSGPIWITPQKTLKIKGAIQVEGAYSFETIKRMAPRRWRKVLVVFANLSDEQIFQLSPINNITNDLLPQLLIYADQFEWTKICAIEYHSAILMHELSSFLHHAVGKTHTSVMTTLLQPGNLELKAILQFISKTIITSPLLPSSGG